MGVLALACAGREGGGVHRRGWASTICREGLTVSQRPGLGHSSKKAGTRSVYIPSKQAL